MEHFQFAGFTFPRRVARMAIGAAQLRNKWRSRRMWAGEYTHAPQPNNNTGRGFYLASDGQPFTRWQWADDVADARIRNNGWYADEFQDQTIRGIVARLPHGRYLAGWAMGEHMAAAIDPEIYTDIVDAASAADDLARIAAEREQDYQREQAELDAAADMEGEEFTG